jgi:hypothetical protein
MLGQIRDAILGLGGGALQGGETNLIISLASPFYVGLKMRFIALSDGAALEVQDSGGTWHEETRWTEA